MTRLTVLNYNTHVGINLWRLARLYGGLKAKPDLILLQECNSPWARVRVRALWNPVAWSCVGTFPASHGPHASGTLILARRSVLKRLGWRNPLISAGRPGDRMHPQRRGTLGRYLHRPTGQQITVSSMHPWHTKGALPDGPIRRGHDAQVDWYATAAKVPVNRGHVAIFGGDTNEHVDNRASSRVEKELWAAGLKPARPNTDHTPRLDEVFVDRPTRVLAYARHTIPGGEPEHQAIVVHLEIKETQ